MALEDQSPEITTPEPATTELPVETATDVTQEPAPSASEAEDAAFLQGFDGTQPEAPAEPEPEPEPLPEPEPPKFAGKTEAEILEVFERVNQFGQREAKMFGTLGSLKQQVEAVKAQAQPSSVKLDVEKLNRFKDEYPDLAESLIDGLSSALQVSGSAPVSYEEVARLAAQIASEQTTQVERKFESQLLTVKHPDWKEVVTSEQYEKWKSALPDADRNQLDNSWDSDFIGQKLSEFKDWKSKTVQTKQSNQRRLEAAIAPRGNPQKPPSLSPEEEFMKGFNSLGPVR